MSDSEACRHPSSLATVERAPSPKALLRGALKVTVPWKKTQQLLRSWRQRSLVHRRGESLIPRAAATFRDAREGPRGHPGAGAHRTSDCGARDPSASRHESGRSPGFLAAIYNGYDFSFDLMELCVLDTEFAIRAWITRTTIGSPNARCIITSPAIASCSSGSATTESSRAFRAPGGAGSQSSCSDIGIFGSNRPVCGGVERDRAASVMLLLA